MKHIKITQCKTCKAQVMINYCIEKGVNTVRKYPKTKHDCTVADLMYKKEVWR